MAEIPKSLDTAQPVYSSDAPEAGQDDAIVTINGMPAEPPTGKPGDNSPYQVSDKLPEAESLWQNPLAQELRDPENAELIGVPPESKPDKSHGFKQDDIRFMNHMAGQVAELNLKIADPQTRRAELVRLLGSGFSHIQAVKAGEDPAKDIGLVFSAFSLGAAPNYEQSEGVAQQLRGEKQLSQAELNNLLGLSSLAWRHKSNGVPDAVVASEIQGQVGGALSALRQQPDYDALSPSSYETAMIAFATGVCASVPQLRMDEQLYKAMQANARPE